MKKTSAIVVFGRQPEISRAELLGYASAQGITLNFEDRSAATRGGDSSRLRRDEGATQAPDKDDIASVVSGFASADLAVLANDLGGVVKVAEVVTDGKIPGTVDEWVAFLFPALQTKESLSFGLSFYGNRSASARDQERIALTLKKMLRESSGHVRWVSGRGKPLTSVVVDKNGLAGQKGHELIIVAAHGHVTVGRTVAVQPFEEWGERDFGRPRRNAKQGMLPPKLARMLVNMVGVKPAGTLLDPFCGSGTVIMEAALVGWQNFIGTDKNAMSVKDAERNLSWIEGERGLDITHKLFAADVANLGREVPPNSVSVIVTEPYLGPPLNERATPQDVSRIEKEVLSLYANMLDTFARVLKPGGRAVFVLPSWSVKQRSWATRLTLPQGLRWRKLLPELQEPLVYSRPDQFVGREILSIEKS